METKDDITLVSPCGGYCGDCPAYKVKDDSSWGEALKKFNWNGVPCQGCRPLKRCRAYTLEYSNEIPEKIKYRRRNNGYMLSALCY